MSNSISEKQMDFSEQSKSQKNQRNIKNGSESVQRTNNKKVPTRYLLF